MRLYCIVKIIWQSKQFPASQPATEAADKHRLMLCMVRYWILLFSWRSNSCLSCHMKWKNKLTAVSPLSHISLVHMVLCTVESHPDVSFLSRFFDAPHSVPRLTGVTELLSFFSAGTAHFCFASHNHSRSATHWPWLLWHRHDITKNLKHVLARGAHASPTLLPESHRHDVKKIHIAGPNPPKTYPLTFFLLGIVNTRHKNRGKNLLWGNVLSGKKIH